MLIEDVIMSHFIKRIKEDEHFAIVGYSDAEWLCVLNQVDRMGTQTGLGQTLCPVHGQRLFDVLKRRSTVKDFIFAIPKCLAGLPSFCNGEIQSFLEQNNITLEAVERDMLTDDLSREADLYPFIQVLKTKSTVFIGPEHLKGLKGVFPRFKFVEISSPNLHHKKVGIESAVFNAQCQAEGQPKTVFLVSAGVSAAVIIDQLYDRCPQASFIDCGSIWDAFFNQGSQREWRAKLYEDVRLHAVWLRKNLSGKD